MWKRFIAALKKIVTDLFTDIRGAVDEKRFWGNVLMALGVYVVIVNAGKLDQYTWITAGGLFGFGIVILGIAASADSKIGSLNVPVAIPLIEKIKAMAETIKPAPKSAAAAPDPSDHPPEGETP
jgi:hypothetical protein